MLEQKKNFKGPFIGVTALVFLVLAVFGYREAAQRRLFVPNETSETSVSTVDVLQENSAAEKQRSKESIEAEELVEFPGGGVGYASDLPVASDDDDSASTLAAVFDSNIASSDADDFEDAIDFDDDPGLTEPVGSETPTDSNAPPVDALAQDSLKTEETNESTATVAPIESETASVDVLAQDAPKVEETNATTTATDAPSDSSEIPVAALAQDLPETEDSDVPSSVAPFESETSPVDPLALALSKTETPGDLAVPEVGLEPAPSATDPSAQDSNAPFDFGAPLIDPLALDASPTEDSDDQASTTVPTESEASSLDSLASDLLKPESLDESTIPAATSAPEDALFDPLAQDAPKTEDSYATPTPDVSTDLETLPLDPLAQDLSKTEVLDGAAFPDVATEPETPSIDPLAQDLSKTKGSDGAAFPDVATEPETPSIDPLAQDLFHAESDASTSSDVPAASGEFSFDPLAHDLPKTGVADDPAPTINAIDSEGSSLDPLAQDAPKSDNSDGATTPSVDPSPLDSLAQDAPGTDDSDERTFDADSREPEISSADPLAQDAPEVDNSSDELIFDDASKEPAAANPVAQDESKTDNLNEATPTDPSDSDASPFVPLAQDESKSDDLNEWTPADDSIKSETSADNSIAQDLTDVEAVTTGEQERTLETLPDGLGIASGKVASKDASSVSQDDEFTVNQEPRRNGWEIYQPESEFDATLFELGENESTNYYLERWNSLDKAWQEYLAPLSDTERLVVIKRYQSEMDKTSLAIAKRLAFADDLSASKRDGFFRLYASLLARSKETAALTELLREERGNKSSADARIGYLEVLLFESRVKIAGDSNDADGLLNMSKELVRQASTSEVKYFLRKTKYLADLIGQYDQNLGERTFSVVCQEFANSQDPFRRNMPEVFAGEARFESLPGNELLLCGADVDGRDVDLKDYRGKTTLVVFANSSCAPYLDELATLRDAYAKYRAAGFEIVEYNLDADVDGLRKFVQTQNIPWTVVSRTLTAQIDGKDFVNPCVYYGIANLPTTILLDKNGKVISTRARRERLTEELAEIYPNVR